MQREGSCIGYKNKDELLFGLKMLVNNVILIRDDHHPYDAFHPRIEVWKTTSFQAQILKSLKRKHTRARAHTHTHTHTHTQK